MRTDGSLEMKDFFYFFHFVFHHLHRNEIKMVLLWLFP